MFKPSASSTEDQPANLLENSENIYKFNSWRWEVEEKAAEFV